MSFLQIDLPFVRKECIENAVNVCRLSCLYAPVQDVICSACRDFSHGIAAHLDAVSIVNQAVQNAISECRSADLFVPA
jgi:hypothetical protein